MPTPRRCGTCSFHCPGHDPVSGHCAHPLRQNGTGVALLVRSAELACRTDWGADCWEPIDCPAEINLRIWGPFTGSDMSLDLLPSDLLACLVRQSSS